MNFLHERQEAQELNLAPLIDVVFILLIFFMVTTTFEKQAFLHINLPKADITPETTQQTPHELIVDENGYFYLQGRKVLNARPTTLLAGIQQMKWRDKNRQITIRADARAPHQSVVTALQTLTRLGYRRISISTTPSP